MIFFEKVVGVSFEVNGKIRFSANVFCIQMSKHKNII